MRSWIARVARGRVRGAAGAWVLAVVTLAACADPSREAAAPLPPRASEAPPIVAVASCAPNSSQTGLASWYGEAFHLKHTASGEPFDMNDLTAAHRWLPLNTIVKVTNLRNGRSAVLRINDRGPYIRGRTLDVSRYAAAQLGMKGTGVTPVRIDVYDLDRQDGDTAIELSASGTGATRPATPGVTPAVHFPMVGSLATQP
jgi:rare lipoprotein A (peptidoglycan hydrolase)